MKQNRNQPATSILLFLFIIIGQISFLSGTNRVITLQSGNKLAVLPFEGRGISAPLTAHVTEEFRKAVRSLNIYQVQDKDITERLEIFTPKSKTYWNCWSVGCAIDRGRQLNANYVIAGNVEEKNDTYLINGRLFSIDLETLVNDFSLSSFNDADSLLLELKKMAYTISGLPIPDTLGLGSDTTRVNELATDDSTPKLKLPKIPSKIKALLMSTALPGSGQLWSKKKYQGWGFMSMEATLGFAALISYYQYDQKWENFQENYDVYLNGTDPHNLLEYRPQIVQYAKESNQYNSYMKQIKNVAIPIWIINMVHAYVVAPNDDFFDGEFFFDIEYDQKINQVKTGLSIPLE
ncbi:MAG: hypothetical protein HOK52_11395 [Candidatus Marinimicrobia bacterium]|jgi:hypothetical protein|nr:hypothetical protein [Candidatus Neomarinimicrobiota bacterium]MBT3936664.1 hypothetical protein [Candidatus Neomarinimicrobiota bacterium]MBT3961664.1 hypothetical protein [Candidatus Neomarinimicrobiota bacterium]MBT4382141.1 hypothetical protein [Candidatus Neomarinimicrobiota bacterium]MBT4636798.1 hypothetical protein [Candidatus Neomarinimicrobiota bacterium]